MKPIYLVYVVFHLYQNIRQNDELPHLYDHTQVPTLAYPYDRFQSVPPSEPSLTMAFLHFLCYYTKSSDKRLDFRDVLEMFRASGPGWQTRLNAALRDWLKSHSPTRGS